MNKNIFLILTAFLGTGFSAQVAKPIQVSGTSEIQNFNIVESSELSKIKLPDQNIAQKISTDENKKYSVSFNASQCGYYRAFRNHFYVCPNDKIEMNLSEDNTETTFAGSYSELNNYLLNASFPKAGSYLEAGKKIKEDIPLTISEIDNSKIKKLADLEKIQNLPNEVKNLEKIRIEADYINSILSLATYYPLVKNITDKNELESVNQEVKKHIDEIKIPANFLNVKYLALPHYEQIVPFLLEKSNPQNIGYQQLKDWKNAADLSLKMQRIKNKEEISALFNQEIKGIKNQQYRKVLTEIKTQLTSFGKGDLAKNFTAKDEKGKPQSLEQFRGKVIYLDLWATWCQPCLQEMPHYEELKEKFKDNPDIVFISLSIDDNEAVWKRNLERRKATGHQWIIPRSSLKDYNVVGVPRTITIDKDFRIVEFQGQTPSEEIKNDSLTKLLK